jgi:uncharacterized membrane protein
MRRLSLGGVPLHPALVHFPIVFWVLAPLFDLGFLLGLGNSYWRLGWWSALAGIVTAMPAIIAGTLDALACRGISAADATLWRHAGLMLSAWSLFAIASVLCSPDNSVQAQFLGVAMHTIGALVLGVGAHAGGRLAHVYHLPGACKEVRAPQV